MPLPFSALKAKFMANATRAIRPEEAERIVERVMALESADSLDEIVALCVLAP